MQAAIGFLTDKAAIEYEKFLCKDWDIPFDTEKRREQASDKDPDILHYRMTFVDGAPRAEGEEC